MYIQTYDIDDVLPSPISLPNETIDELEISNSGSDWIMDDLEYNTAPKANDDEYSVEAGAILDVPMPGVLWNDEASNAYGWYNVEVELVELPSYGNVWVNSHDGSFKYQTNDNKFTGKDYFRYKFWDHDKMLYSNVATVFITVNPANDAPVAIAQTVSTNEDVALDITLSATDVDGDLLTYSIVTPPTHGTLIGTAPDLTYTPNPNYKGGDSFSFTASDGSLTSVPATVSITVDPVNDAPVVILPTLPASINELVDFSFAASATDVDGDDLIFSLVGAPLGAEIDPGTGVFSWTPTEEQDGLHSFTVEVSDGALTASQLVEVMVNEVNVAPELTSIGNKEVVAGGTLAFTISATDVDRPLQQISYSASPLPQGATFDVATGAFEWTTAKSQVGTYEVTFSASDGLAITSELITITVNRSSTVAAPSISSFSPTSGPVGTEVTITGTNLSEAISVTFNGTVAPEVLSNTATEILVKVPTGASTGKISVTTAGGVANSTQRFTVTNPVQAPSISSFTPTSGPVGTQVTISGSNLLDATSVAFNGTPATEILSNTATEIIARVPAGATTGSISVSTLGGTVKSKQRFTVTAGTAIARVNAQQELSGEEQEPVAYPNPFGDQALVSFSLRADGAYRIVLYDAKGVLVEVLKQGYAKAGERMEVPVNGEGLGSGLYLVQLTNGGAHQTIKLIYTK